MNPACQQAARADMRVALGCVRRGPGFVVERRIHEHMIGAALTPSAPKTRAQSRRHRARRRVRTARSRCARCFAPPAPPAPDRSRSSSPRCRARARAARGSRRRRRCRIRPHARPRFAGIARREQDRIMPEAMAAFRLQQTQAAAEHGVVGDRRTIRAHRGAIRARGRHPAGCAVRCRHVLPRPARAAAECRASLRSRSCCGRARHGECRRH